MRMRKIPSNSLSITESRSGSVCSAIQMMGGGGCDGCVGCCDWRWCTKRRVRGFSKMKKKEEESNRDGFRFPWNRNPHELIIKETYLERRNAKWRCDG